MGKHLAHVLIFFIGMTAATAALHSVDEMPFWGGIKDKMTHLSDHLDRYDTIFLGSSRVEFGFIPASYDARMAELGKKTTTLNLGKSGFRQHDYDAVIDWLIANKPPKLRRLMIELHAWVQGPRNSNWMTAQEIEIHPIQHLPARLQSIAIDRNGWETRLEHAVHATMHGLANYLRVGQGPRIFKSIAARATGRSPWQSKELRDGGWKELSEARMRKFGRKRRLDQHRNWKEGREKALRTLASKRRNLTPPAHQGGFNVASLRQQVARLREIGIEPVYVVMPHYAFNFYGRDGIREVRDEITILEFDVVSENEDLHEFDLWFDHAHMMKPGAEMLSVKLANRVHALGKD